MCSQYVYETHRMFLKYLTIRGGLKRLNVITLELDKISYNKQILTCKINTICNIYFHR